MVKLGDFCSVSILWSTLNTFKIATRATITTIFKYDARDHQKSLIPKLCPQLPYPSLTIIFVGFNHGYDTYFPNTRLDILSIICER